MKNLFSNPPVLSKYLFIFLAAALDVLAIKSFMQINANMDEAITYAINAFLMFAGAAIMLICAFNINVQKKLFFGFAVVFLGLNIIMTIFVLICIVEIIFVILAALNLYVLLKYRTEFIESQPNA